MSYKDWNLGGPSAGGRSFILLCIDKTNVMMFRIVESLGDELEGPLRWASMASTIEQPQLYRQRCRRGRFNINGTLYHVGILRMPEFYGRQLASMPGCQSINGADRKSVFEGATPSPGPILSYV